MPNQTFSILKIERRVIHHKDFPLESYLMLPNLSQCLWAIYITIKRSSDLSHDSLYAVRSVLDDLAVQSAQIMIKNCQHKLAKISLNSRSAAWCSSKISLAKKKLWYVCSNNENTAQIMKIQLKLWKISSNLEKSVHFLSSYILAAQTCKNQLKS